MHSPSSWGVLSQLRGVDAMVTHPQRKYSSGIFWGRRAWLDDWGQGRWQLQFWFVFGLHARLRSQVPGVQSCHFPNSVTSDKPLASGSLSSSPLDLSSREDYVESAQKRVWRTELCTR